MHKTIEKLLENGPVVTDGAWGTQLQLRGLKPGACPDEWNLTNPDKVEAVARDYVEAGSQIILTNTFGSSPLMLGSYELADKAWEINRAGAAISARAAAGKAKVFASMGPCGKLLLAGDVTEAEIEDSFSMQAEALQAGGADGLVIETMSDTAEAEIALRCAKRTGLPVVACMVYDSGPDMQRTMMGTTVTDAVVALTEAGADVIGANCGQGVEGFVALSRSLKAATHLPVWIKANAGLPTLVNAKVHYDSTAEKFCESVPAILTEGADFIGGCCGTTPDYIRAVRTLIDNRKS